MIAVVFCPTCSASGSNSVTTGQGSSEPRQPYNLADVQSSVEWISAALAHHPAVPDRDAGTGGTTDVSFRVCHDCGLREQIYWPGCQSHNCSVEVEKQRGQSPIDLPCTPAHESGIQNVNTVECTREHDEEF